MVLTLVMCFLCKAAGAAVLQPGSWRFKSLRFSMSLGKAACLQSLNLLKTSSCICRPILHISVYCCRIFIWEIGDLTSLGLILKSTGDWQTNKQTGLKITKPVGRHHDGWIVSQRHTSDHSVLLLCHERLCERRRSWLTVGELTGQWSQHLFSNRTSAVHIIYDPFVWNMIRLTHIMIHVFIALSTLEAYSGLGVSEHWRIVQSFTQPLWSDHSSQAEAGWCLARSVHSEEPGGGGRSLMESGVCVMLGSTEWNGVSVSCGHSELAALMEDGVGEGDELSKWVSLYPLNPLHSHIFTHIQTNTHTHTCQSLPYASHLWAQSGIWSKVWTPYSWDSHVTLWVLIWWVG